MSFWQRPFQQYLNIIIVTLLKSGLQSMSKSCLQMLLILCLQFTHLGASMSWVIMGSPHSGFPSLWDAHWLVQVLSKSFCLSPQLRLSIMNVITNPSFSATFSLEHDQQSQPTLNPNKVDVWNPCQVMRVVATTTTLKKCYKLCLFHQIVSQIRAYIKQSSMVPFSVSYIALLIKKNTKNRKLLKIT